MDLQKIIDYITSLVQLIFSTPVPNWVLKTIWIIVGLVSIYFVIAKIIEAWNTAFAPIFYKPEEKRRSKRRRRFAQYILNEVTKLDRQEEWSDYRFTDLEAEIEADGHWRPWYWVIPSKRVRTGPRREKSLSSALKTSKDHINLLEGDPGSGKSISLRHLTNLLATKATRSRSTTSRIPIYINLRGLKHSKGKEINKQLIRNHILSSLSHANDRDIEEFLDEEFDRGIEDGTWLFLFDSFDEIPDVLSSTEADEIIARYSEAIIDFLNIMNNCRGVIASRYFRGPSQKSLPTFRILPLSERRQLKLIQNAELPVDSEKKMLGELSLARDEIRTIAGNPMFLGLLCDYMKTGNKFPENSHIVFETYITRRLNKDQERLKRRFDLQADDIRSLAENIAFCMTANQDSGLSPRRATIIEGMNRQNFAITNEFHKILDALEFIKLARSENEASSIDDRVFTFAHRRFQEYFSTCVVLKEPHRVTTQALITDARWRETCSTLFQTQPLEKINPLLIEATKTIESFSTSIKDEYKDEWVSLDKRLNLKYEFPKKFSWPKGLLHILGLLQDGFNNRLNLLPEVLRETTGKLLLIGIYRGNHLDKKWALEVARVSNEKVFHRLIEYAFESKSQWLQNTAYQQLGRVQKITATVEERIWGMLLDLIQSNRFIQERYAIYSFLARLPNPGYFINIYNHLLWTIYIDLVFFSSVAVIGLTSLLLNIADLGVPYFLMLSFTISLTLSPLVIWKTPKLFDMPTLQLRYIFAFASLSFLTFIFFDFSLFSVILIMGIYILWLAPSVLTLMKQAGRFIASKNWLLAPLFLLNKTVLSIFNKIQLPKIYLPDVARNLIKLLQKLFLISIFILVAILLFYYREQVNIVVQSIINFIKSIAAYIALVLLGVPATILTYHLSKYLMLLIKDETRRKATTQTIIDNFKTVWVFFRTLQTASSTYERPELFPTSFESFRFNKWRKSQTISLNVFQFLDAISYADKKYSFLAINHVRDNNLLQINKRSEQVIEVFVQHLENALISRRVRYSKDDETLINAPENFVLWLLKYQRSFGYLSRFGVGFLDETSKLLEEIKKRQAKTV